MSWAGVKLPSIQFHEDWRVSMHLSHQYAPRGSCRKMAVATLTMQEVVYFTIIVLNEISRRFPFQVWVAAFGSVVSNRLSKRFAWCKKQNKTILNEFTQGLRQEKYIYMRGVWVGCAYEKRWVCFWWARKESRQMARSVWALASISGHREKQQKGGGGKKKQKSGRAKQASAPVQKPKLSSCANNAPLPLHSKLNSSSVL